MSKDYFLMAKGCGVMVLVLQQKAGMGVDENMAHFLLNTQDDGSLY